MTARPSSVGSAHRLPSVPKDVEWRLPRHPRSVGRSRVLLREQARSWKVPDDTADTAVLLLSELMTNACRHAHVSPGREVGARCILRRERLRVEVSDACADLPQPRDAEADDEAGRGLALVAALADEWGACHRRCGIGKTVWFELEVPACAPPPNGDGPAL
jgi:anti-sigma regulatory factor (Ser/Thr protein kinase)